MLSRSTAVSMGLYLVLLPTGSARGANEYAIMGLGSLSCAKFAELYRLAPERTDSEIVSWAQGYMSGMNISSFASSRMSKNLNISLEFYSYTIRIYCDQHPLRDVFHEIMDLYKSLPENHRVQ